MRYSPRQPTLGRYGQVRIDTREPPRYWCDPVGRAACVGLLFSADDGARLVRDWPGQPAKACVLAKVKPLDAV